MIGGESPGGGRLEGRQTRGKKKSKNLPEDLNMAYPSNRSKREPYENVIEKIPNVKKGDNESVLNTREQSLKPRLEVPL